MKTHRLSRTESPRGSTTVRTAESSVHATSRPPAMKAIVWAAMLIGRHSVGPASLRAEFGRVGDELVEVAVAEDAHRDGLANALADHQPLQVAGLFDGGAVDVEDEVLLPETGGGGGAAGDDLDDLDPEATVDGRCR